MSGSPTFEKGEKNNVLCVSPTKSLVSKHKNSHGRDGEQLNTRSGDRRNGLLVALTT